MRIHELGQWKPQESYLAGGNSISWNPACCLLPSYLNLHFCSTHNTNLISISWLYGSNVSLWFTAWSWRWWRSTNEKGMHNENEATLLVSTGPRFLNHNPDSQSESQQYVDFWMKTRVNAVWNVDYRNQIFETNTTSDHILPWKVDWCSLWE